MKRFVVLLTLLVSSAPVCALDLNGLKAKLGELSAPPAPASATSTAASVPSPSASVLTQFTLTDQVGSLKQALTQGAEAAVTQLAKENGYLGNAKVRIPLPENLQKAEQAMRRVGLGKYVDDFNTAMNRAAEAAVPEAKTLLLNAVKNMTVNDAKDILLGKDDAATHYFRRNTEVALGDRFKPIVAKSMQKVSLAQAYERFAGKGVKLGLVKERDTHLDDYITRKALDGLFLKMAEQEKEIRAHPLQATGDLAKKVFAVLRGQ